MAETKRAAKNERTLISISRKTFFQVTALLLGLLLLSIALTYAIPRGQFGVLPDGGTDYLSYTRRDDLSGIPLYQGLLAPLLVFFSSDGLTLAMLSLFLFTISAAFQVMEDVGGIRALVGAVSERFRGRRRLLLVLVSFLFYCFGSFLGLFEEMLTMLPIVTALCVLVGYDSFTGFLCSILACGFGFASAITNPFTVLLACQIVGADPTEHLWFRLLIFAVMFALLMLFLFSYLRRLERDPGSSLTRAHDEALRAASAPAAETEERPAGERRRLVTVYAVFLLAALALILISSLSPVLRGYSVPILIAYFLIFGIAAGALVARDLRYVLRSFLRGLGGALPTLVFIALAASIKYVFDRGAVLPTIVSAINGTIEGHSPAAVALTIYLIVLLLEFFISSSTAKAILVMGLLAMVDTGLTKPMLVLLYTFADGYTNVLFPTSPVLLIGLSMIGLDHFAWVRKTAPLFLVNFLLVLAFIVLGIAVGY
ncbi:MAG: hypothetical protein IK095_08625 [Oscillospiraceae bacterium]|nr:hypothetical protein [Oscillospiraceae bacterium]